MAESNEHGDGWVVVPHRVIYGDTDAMGVVYYGTYMRYLEVGRCELLRARGRTYREVEASGLLMPVAEVGIKYLAPARYDDLLEIGARIEELGRVSVRFEYRIARAGETLATAFSRHACVDAETRRLTRVPDDLAALLGGRP